MANATRSHDTVLKELRAFGLAYPEAGTKSPWPEHMDLVVRDKTFAFMSVAGVPLSISCKLPQSSEAALLLPFAKPTAYGLGKSGWVSAQFADGEAPPVALLKQWIDESYRAQAPKKLVAQLSGPNRDRPAAASAQADLRAKAGAKPKPAASKQAQPRPAARKKANSLAAGKKAARPGPTASNKTASNKTASKKTSKKASKARGAATRRA